jgi:hypothetical protein
MRHARARLRQAGTGLVGVLLAASLTGPSYGGVNSDHKLAIHLKAHPTSCGSGFPSFASCSAITTTYPGCGDVDVVPVFFDLVEVTAVELALEWPREWGSMSWVRCKGDIDVGGIVRSGDGTAIAWTACERAWSIAPGFGWLTAYTPGVVRAVPHPSTGDYGVVDCGRMPDQVYDYPKWEPGVAGVCGATGDNPCVPKGGAETTWGGIKSIFR